MGEISKIEFENESQEIKPRVKSYWSKRSVSFIEQKRRELKNEKSQMWLSYILDHISNKKDLKILDVGCGTGFFEVLLGKAGYDITGIDLTPEMVECGNTLIKENNLDPERVKCLVMDAENPDFEEGSFDLIITRNLTWTLPHPVEAYEAWYKLLNKEGTLINFDAEYAKGQHKHQMKEHDKKVYETVNKEMEAECHDIYHMLTISSLDRPEWDLEVLKQIGFIEICVDKEAGKPFLDDVEIFHVPKELFCIIARK